MSHIYQPVTLIELLGRQGSASTTEIAKALLGYDVSQIEYWGNLVQNVSELFFPKTINEKTKEILKEIKNNPQLIFRKKHKLSFKHKFIDKINEFVT